MEQEAAEFLNGFLSFFLRLLFPHDMFHFVWGHHDTLAIMLGKRIFLLLPMLAIVVGFWASIFGALSVIVRQGRRDFITAIVITWWDLGKSILNFWGGTFKFAFYLSASLIALIKFLIVGFWIIIQDIFLIPFRIVRSIAGNVLKPGVPWIAVGLTVLWCALEALIFTYVMSPLVIDTFSNLTGETLKESFVRIPLFLFMMFIILGSYSVLANLAVAIRGRNVPTIIKILIIEMVAMFVEVVFLYREFVDSLVPWFAQHTSDNFSLGIAGTLGIAGGAWLGIRGLSWFLFADHGTPTLMAIIQGTGIQAQALSEEISPPALELTSAFALRIRNEIEWLQKKGDELLASFILPPLQVIAAGVNFCILIISGRHLFSLPFKNISDIVDSKDLLDMVSRKGRPESRDAARQAS